ncbi:hypothetical protein Pyn_30151 [Prunus yedoensis var. nudiflora]|uniref:Uncharacterized protein n=1 Tax=Prunus yedoensis var. nudiflora TaxID=2094558 RepID=A0A314UDM3_PRUYE|nr:hypothetical protein Pyn_30151 [Prunus yedoensis var. nudiflora]
MAVVEDDLDVEVLESVVDLGPTAVDEDGPEADTGEEDNVGLGFGAAAVIDDDGLASKRLDEGERLGEDIDSDLTRRFGGMTQKASKYMNGRHDNEMGH